MSACWFQVLDWNYTMPWKFLFRAHLMKLMATVLHRTIAIGHELTRQVFKKWLDINTICLHASTTSLHLTTHRERWHAHVSVDHTQEMWHIYTYTYNCCAIFPPTLVTSFSETCLRHLGLLWKKLGMRGIIFRFGLSKSVTDCIMLTVVSFLAQVHWFRSGQKRICLGVRLAWPLWRKLKTI